MDSHVGTGSEDQLEDILNEHSGKYLEQFPEIPKDLVAEYKAEIQAENQNSWHNNSIDLTAEEEEYHTPTMTDTVQSTDSVEQSTSTWQQSQISPHTPQQSPQLLSQQQSRDTEHPGGIVATQLDNHGNLLKQILENQQRMQGNISKLDTHLSAINHRISQQAASIHDLEQRVVSLEASEPNAQTEKLQSLEDCVNFMERKQRERNIRLIGIPENQYENCYDVVSMTQELQVYVNVEVAHRTGRSGQQQPRHIIARVASAQGKLDILRAQKHFLKNKACFFVEDLTKKDYETKQALKQ